MTYEHIKDCWKVIREYDEQGKSYDDLYDLIQGFPRWSGDWDILPNEYNECLVINTYYDEQCEVYEEDQEDTHIPWPIERDEEEAF